MDVAQEDISFRLSRSGTRIRAEARMYAKSAPNRYTLDRPFLIYMKKRDASQPFFVMWVDNAELLQPFE